MKGGLRKKTSSGGVSGDSDTAEEMYGAALEAAAEEVEEQVANGFVEGEEKKNEDGGIREEEEKGQEEMENGYDQFGHMKDAEDENGDEEDEGEEDEGDEEDEEKPTLGEGFYEIEDIRRKRVRKGQVQYFIKWRGWPESANTWEPVENLLTCSDLVDAFEERSSRKRKRKNGRPTPQTKKKAESFAEAACNMRAGRVKFIDEPFIIPSPDDESPNDSGEDNMGDIKNDEAAEKINPQVEEGKNDMDVNHSEARHAVVTNESNVDKLAVNLQELGSSQRDCLVDLQSKDDGEPSVQLDHHTRGRRRKAASVRRFKQELKLCGTNSAARGVKRFTRSGGIAGHERDQNKSDNINGTCSITEIMKPIGHTKSVLNNVQDVSVTFVAKSSDGKEVLVDNKYLKAMNPQLLINYYEKHLRYDAA